MSERRDDSWLLARERGEAVDQVTADERRRYDNLQRHLADLPANAAPSGWQDRVFLAIEAPKRRSRARWIAASGFAVAAAIAIVVIGRGGGNDGADERDSITWNVQHGTGQRRGDSAATIGDTLVIRARGVHLVEARAYHANQPAFARCPSASCSLDGTFDVEIRMHGDVEVVAFYDVLPPAASTNLDADVRAAHAIGSRSFTEAPVPVQ